MSFSDLDDKVELQPMVRQTISVSNELQITVAHANFDLLSDRNRSNISAALGNANSMLAGPSQSPNLDQCSNRSAQLRPLWMI
jgi:hypothetical protein